MHKLIQLIISATLAGLYVTSSAAQVLVLINSDKPIENKYYFTVEIANVGSSVLESAEIKINSSIPGALVFGNILEKSCGLTNVEENYDNISFDLNPKELAQLFGSVCEILIDAKLLENVENGYVKATLVAQAWNGLPIASQSTTALTPSSFFDE